MSILDRWNRNPFSVYKSKEEDVLGLVKELGDYNNENIRLLQEVQDYLKDVILNTIEQKVNIDYVNDLFENGDFKGSWQGVERPSMSQEGIQGQVDNNTSNISKLQTYVSVDSYAHLVVDNDWTVAIQTCLDENKSCILGRGTYNISSPITTKNYYNLVGLGQGQSILKINCANKPALTLGGKFVEVSNMTISRSNWDKTSTKENGIEINDSSFLGQSNLEKLEIENCYNGIYCSSNTNMYSCTLQDLWVHNFTGYAIRLTPYGSTGCVLSNIYVTNWSNYSTKEKESAYGGVFIKNYNEVTITQLNVEHGFYDYACYFGDCGLVKINALHIEGFETRANYKAMLMADGSLVNIGEMSLVYSSPKFDRETKKVLSNITMWALLGLSRGGQIICTSLQNVKNFQVESLNSSPHQVSSEGVSSFIVYNADNAQTSREKTSVSIMTHKNTDGYFKTFSGLAWKDGYRKHQIKQYGDINYYTEYSNKRVNNMWLNALPSNGKWYDGDVISNVGKSVGEYKDYICTQGGYLNQPVSTVIGTCEQYKNTISLSNGQGDFVKGDTITIGDSTKTYVITNIYTDSNTNLLTFALDKNTDKAFTNAVIIYATPIFSGVNKIGG